ncbi:BRO family protein [Brevibacillus agri]
MQLTIAKSEQFENVQCDFWRNENGEVFMTIAQLAQALGYADKSGVEKILQRNDYLRSNEFSSTHKLWVGGTDKLSVPQETRIFTEDGIYEITMLSKTKVAREFRAFVRKVLKSLRRGEVVLVQPSSEDAKLKIQQARAEAMLINARTRQARLILEMQKNKTLSPVAVELLNINALEHLIDKSTEYRPDIGGKHYTATEIGKELGISANKVGKIANAHGLKTDEYGIMALDKSPYSEKQVPSFRYNERGRQKLIELVKGNG